MSEFRDKLRSKTVGAKKVFKKIIVEWEGDKFEIRQPTVAMRAEITKKSLEGFNRDAIDGGSIVESIDPGRLQVYSVIYCTFVPGTDDLVFEEADFDMLRSQPSGGFMDLFAANATKLINEKPKLDAKN